LPLQYGANCEGIKVTTATPTRSAAVPSGAAAAAPAVSESRIDRDSHFNGLYETKQNLRIEGIAEGEIQCEGTLTVAEGARVKAKVTASTVTIAGELDGEVLCHGVFQILPTGEVQATVSAHRLIVQEGGLYNGEFRMITGEAPRQETKRSPARDDRKKALEPEPKQSDTTEAVGSDEWWKKFTAGDSALKEGDEPAGAATDESS